MEMGEIMETRRIWLRGGLDIFLPLFVYLLGSWGIDCQAALQMKRPEELSEEEWEGVQERVRRVERAMVWTMARQT